MLPLQGESDAVVGALDLQDKGNTKHNIMTNNGFTGLLQDLFPVC